MLLAGDAVVPLTPTEERFLRVLVEAAGLRVAKDAIADQVWTRTAVADASLSRCVHTLRRKLQATAPAAAVITTCYGRGYRLAMPVARVAAEHLRPAAVARFPERDVRPEAAPADPSARALRAS